jgi:uncharacterized protein
MAIEAALATGIAFGLGSSLHCAAMCGSLICGTSMFALAAPDERSRLQALTALHLGRISTYVMLGVMAASSASLLLSLANASHHAWFRWASAGALLWAGLVIAGMIPRLSAVDTAMGRLSTTVARAGRPLTPGRPPAAAVMGALWGLNACPMLYGAVFAAGLSGSVTNGALFMAAFGLGTIPAVVLGGLGIRKLTLCAHSATAKYVTGAAVASIGLLSFAVTDPASPWLCLTPAQ